jgi:hypothetical protein
LKRLTAQNKPFKYIGMLRGEEKGGGRGKGEEKRREKKRVITE